MPPTNARSPSPPYFRGTTQPLTARQVWLWFRSEGLSFPLRTNGVSEIRWVAPTYTTIHSVLRNPVYAGAYVYGKTRVERYVNPQGGISKRLRQLPRDSGRFSSVSTTRATSTGRPMKRSKAVWAATPDRSPTRPEGR